MCLGVPGRVLEVSVEQPELASADVEGVVRAINLSLLADDPAVPGEWVLIHLGFALNKMTEDEVAEICSARAILDGGGESAVPVPAGLGQGAS